MPRAAERVALVGAAGRARGVVLGGVGEDGELALELHGAAGRSGRNCTNIQFATTCRREGSLRGRRYERSNSRPAFSASGACSVGVCAGGRADTSAAVKSTRVPSSPGAPDAAPAGASRAGASRAEPWPGPPIAPSLLASSASLSVAGAAARAAHPRAPVRRSRRRSVRARLRVGLESVGSSHLLPRRSRASRRMRQTGRPRRAPGGAPDQAGTLKTWRR